MKVNGEWLASYGSMDEEDSTFEFKSQAAVDIDEAHEQFQLFQQKTKIILIIVTAIYSIALPISILPAIFSIMVGNNINLESHITLYSLLALPVVLLFTILSSWAFNSFKFCKTALSLLALPLINGILIAVAILFPEIFNYSFSF